MRQFELFLKDKFDCVIHAPKFTPPMKFNLDKCNVPSYFCNDLPESTDLLSFSHNCSNFALKLKKQLTKYDVKTGFLVDVFIFFCTFYFYYIFIFPNFIFSIVFYKNYLNVIYYI